jgi:hypothetical protein
MVSSSEQFPKEFRKEDYSQALESTQRQGQAFGFSAVEIE